MALTNTHDIELEATLQQLPFNLRSDAIETDMAPREDSRRGGTCSGHGGEGDEKCQVDRWSIVGVQCKRCKKEDIEVQLAEETYSGKKIETSPQRIELVWYRSRGREQP